MNKGFNITKKAHNVYYLDVRIKSKGRQKRTRLTFKGTLHEAEERYLEIRNNLKESIPEASSLTFVNREITNFGDMIDLALEKKINIGKSQRGKYLTIKNDLGKSSLDTIADDLESYLKMLQFYPSKRTGRGLSRTTLNRQIEIVRSVMNLAVDLDIIQKNPITKARFPKAKEIPRDRILSKQEINRLISVMEIEAPHLVPMFKFAIKVPCRKSELINMKVEDLDLDHMAIRLKNGQTKNDRGLWKPIPPDMREYFQNIPFEAKYLFYRKDKWGYHGLGDFKKSWVRCLKLAGIEDFKWHDTRHIAATYLLDNGTPPMVVQEVAGWKTNMIETYYHRGGKSSFNLINFERPVDSGVRILNKKGYESGCTLQAV